MKNCAGEAAAGALLSGTNIHKTTEGATAAGSPSDDKMDEGSGSDADDSPVRDAQEQRRDDA